MKLKFFVKLTFSMILLVSFLQSCDEDKSSFGNDLQIKSLPKDLVYTDILNAREFSYIESSVPLIDSNGHPVFYQVESIRKGEQLLDETYTSSVTIVNPTTFGATITKEKDGEEVEYDIETVDVSKAGRIIIADENLFGFGDYYFTVRATVEIDGELKSITFDDALHLQVGPELVGGISYCPGKLNFVNGGTVTSDPAQVFGGNPDYRFELGSDSDKLTIDPSTGVISANTSYTASEREDVTPIVNIVNNHSEETVSFENTFTAVLSAEAVTLDKEINYFFYPNLKPTAKNNLAAGGNGWSRALIAPGSGTPWAINNAFWRAQEGKNWVPAVDTQDAIDIRAEAGVGVTRTLLVPFWTILTDFDTWAIMDAVNLQQYAGCFNTKVGFWYKMFLNENTVFNADGSAPINFEIYISDNYTGDVTTTTWTQINDVLECEINNDGTLFTGTPIQTQGDQVGNNLWVRAELDLADYVDNTNFTIAFRVKTDIDEVPTDPAVVVNGSVRLSNVHFVANEK